MQTMHAAASTVLLSLLSTIAMSGGPAAAGPARTGLTAVEELGKQLFFDESLSARRDQACAECHSRDVG